MDVSIIVPVFNELGNIGSLYAKLVSVLSGLGKDYEIIFVDDCSTDGSVTELERIAALDHNVKVVMFRRNTGQTAAMQAGFDFASGSIIIPADGDLQNDPDDIPRLMAKLEEGFDVVSGWRKERKDHAFRRNFPSRVANSLISFVSGVSLSDYGCSLKAYRSEMIKGVRLYGEMHRFIPIYASWQGAKVTEITVTHYPRLSGSSKYGLERIFKVVLDLLLVKYFARYAQKPFYVFGGVALVSFFASSGFALWAIGLKIFFDTSFIKTPLPLICVVTALTGAMCILMGLLAEILMRTYYEAQGKTVYSVRKAINC